MKADNFLQNNSYFADLFIQSTTGLDLDYAHLPVIERSLRRTPVTDDGAWQGEERRQRQDRRNDDRRNTRQMAMLDTRTNQDRRKESRRESDGMQIHSFSCRV